MKVQSYTRIPYDPEHAARAYDAMHGRESFRRNWSGWAAMVDPDLSVSVAGPKGGTVGTYCLTGADVGAELDRYRPTHDVRLLSDLSPYSGLRGVWGLHLFVDPEHRGNGVGRGLIRLAEGMGDYVWGLHAAHLDNLGHWSKRRSVVARLADLSDGSVTYGTATVPKGPYLTEASYLTEVVHGTSYLTEAKEFWEESIPRRDGNKTIWILSHGTTHRTGGPAVVWDNGTLEWWWRGVRHRTDGPAIERADGGRSWWVDGRKHREGGPAVEEPNGTLEWWNYGRRSQPSPEEVDGYLRGRIAEDPAFVATAAFRENASPELRREFPESGADFGFFGVNRVKKFESFR